MPWAPHFHLTSKCVLVNEKMIPRRRSATQDRLRRHADINPSRAISSGITPTSICDARLAPALRRRQSVTRDCLRRYADANLRCGIASGITPMPICDAGLLPASRSSQSAMHAGLATNGRCAPARLAGFGFDLPPHFGHCGSLLSSPARTNAHPAPLLSVQTQNLHSVHGGHILTLFAPEMSH